LVANVALNRLDREIACYNVALGDLSDELLVLELSDRNYGDHRVSVVQSDGSRMKSLRKRISVASTRLDDILHSPEMQDALIWMDIQGYEGHMLAGATKAIEALTPMVFEFTPSALDRFNSYSMLRSALATGHYGKIYDLKEWPGREWICSPATLDSIYEDLKSRNRWTDLLIC
jgi:FkbM family methyltransferase